MGFIPADGTVPCILYSCLGLNDDGSFKIKCLDTGERSSAPPAGGSVREVVAIRV